MARPSKGSRMLSKTARDLHALLHAAGSARVVVADVVEAHLPSSAAMRAPARTWAGPADSRLSATLPHSTPRQQRLRIILEDDGAFARGPVNGVTTEPNLAMVGRHSPASRRSSVVLPDPEGPTTHTNSPSRTSRVMFASTKRRSSGENTRTTGLPGASTRQVWPPRLQRL